jgi:DNA-binding NarL/FixJ family response regulator
MEIGIVLADDHKIFREGVRNLLDQHLDLKVLGEADDGRSAVDLVRQLSPQVVILDVTMPILNGIDAARRILAESPDIKVIALSMHSHQSLVQEMLRAGASGYLLKECAFDELVQAIHSALGGRIYLSSEISRMVLEGYLQTSRKKERPDASSLAPKEREVLQLLAEGKSTEEIAQLLHMSGRTVEKYRSQIMKKLSIHNLAGLTKFAIRQGLTKL